MSCPRSSARGEPLREDVVQTLLDLISIKSDLEHGPAPVIAYARRRLQDAGLKTKIVGPENAPALIATHGRKSGMVFSGHLDTVPIGDGWTKEQGEEEDGRVYGRGAVDMKGACAAMIEAAAALAREDVPVTVAFTSDEEEQMMGVNSVIEEAAVRRAKGIIVGEPTGLCPAYREKGVFRFRLTTRGRGAHSSQPWLGDDAMLKMHYCLDRLLDLAEISSQRSTGMTMCFTTIQGGTKNNVVADHCTAEIDVRFPLPQTPHDVHDIIVNRLRGESYHMDVEYSLEAFESDPSSPLNVELSRFLGTEPIVVPYATEAPRYASVNPDVCICGPGDIALAHAADEFVEVRELEEMYDLLLHLGRQVQG
ncbi:MAG TPA: M20/M25/M40 family metallo-hydrolase [Methanomassiliicoccaceae archaeon]|nr:M20 family metallopeptidase [Euryarchaeota archaeon]HOB38283.1 M20/M25/M40 family metallo-hydrolase [Methanomassiliicoccaceae archaeon]HOK28644.1 M20/M25/M40 family metallo-hydrolase [Methanomassiliicoccaceae archaeon]HQA20724.1 M20/M25/M40 family metallo-hydrolase [Methanomassiliicoccaceae archaeon]